MTKEAVGNINNISEKILITCDSTCDLSPKLIEQYNIKILPLNVILANKIYKDTIDITPQDIYNHYKETGELPKTAAINFVDAKNFFAQYISAGYTIIHFTISSEMSSTYQNCTGAAELFDHVFVIDSRNLSTGVGLLAIHAAEMAQKQKTAAEIVNECLLLREYIDVSFVIDDLEFLHKGGRCSSLEAFGANLLHLKPCIIVQNGKMHVGQKYRGKFFNVLKKYINERLHNQSDLDFEHIFITHAGCDEYIYRECASYVQKLMPFKHIHITQANCTVASHCGKNTLGIIFLHKPSNAINIEIPIN